MSGKDYLVEQKNELIEKLKKEVSAVNFKLKSNYKYYEEEQRLRKYY